MAASSAERLCCAYRRLGQLCLLKPKLVNAAHIKYRHVFHQYAPVMQLDLHPSCDILHYGYPVNQSRRSLFSMPTEKYLHSHEAPLPERLCWKCGRSVDHLDELFFCRCGVVQTPADINFYLLFGMNESFDVDVTQLNHMLIDLQKRLHPDKYHNKSDVCIITEVYQSVKK